MACDYVPVHVCNCWKKYRRNKEADRQRALRKGVKLIEQARLHGELTTLEANQIVSALERPLVPVETKP